MVVNTSPRDVESNLATGDRRMAILAPCAMDHKLSYNGIPRGAAAVIGLPSVGSRQGS
jgi:hypothetical protein